jgi:hypothetical protein
VFLRKEPEGIQGVTISRYLFIQFHCFVTVWNIGNQTNTSIIFMFPASTRRMSIVWIKIGVIIIVMQKYFGWSESYHMFSLVIHKAGHA